MASPAVRIVPLPDRPQIKRARKTKWCAECQGRIEAGSTYIEVSPWRWTHRRCPGEAVIS